MTTWPSPNTRAVQCCIVGAGPAGMMAGLLLARVGVSVLVLEKHADFLRDFRGDTVHPSTLEIMHELGLYDEFLKRPHSEVQRMRLRIGAFEVVAADFSRLPTRAKFVAMMPQWDFLDFLATEAHRYPNFELLMRTSVTSLNTSGTTVTGVAATTLGRPFTVTSDLVLGCDGRHSVVRQQAGLAIQDFGAPIDVLWFRVTRAPGDGEDFSANLASGHIHIAFNRGDYWQCAFVIAKGGFEAIKARGLEAARADIAKLAPHLADRMGEIKNFDDMKLLTVGVDRLTTWHKPGLLCIGDAAHTMSPIGGVGINLAIQDAVAAANILATPLAAGTLTDADLARVQARRLRPTKIIQSLQVQFQKRIISGVLASTSELQPPTALKILARFPALARLPARLIGLGYRPEHVAAIAAAP